MAMTAPVTRRLNVARVSAGLGLALVVTALYLLPLENPYVAMWLPVGIVTAAVLTATIAWAVKSPSAIKEISLVAGWFYAIGRDIGGFFSKETLDFYGQPAKSLWGYCQRSVAGWHDKLNTLAWYAAWHRQRYCQTVHTVIFVAVAAPALYGTGNLIWLSSGLQPPHRQTTDLGFAQVTAEKEWCQGERNGISTRDNPGAIQLTRVSGGSWERDEKAAMEDYTSILAIGQEEAMFTIDTEPFIVVRDELGCRRQPLPTGCIARALAGTKNGPRFAFGKDGLVFRQRGENWEIDNTADMQPADFTQAVSVSERDIVAVTGSNHVFRWNGQWSMSQLPAGESITALTALRCGIVLIGTRSGHIYQQVDGWKTLPSVWTEAEIRQQAGGPITGIAGKSIDDYRVVSRTSVYHREAGRWSRDDTTNCPPPENRIVYTTNDYWYNASVGQSCRLIDERWQVIPLPAQTRSTIQMSQSGSTVWAIAAGQGRTEVLRYIDTPSYVGRGTVTLKLESFQHQPVHWNRVEARKTVTVETAATLRYSADGKRWFRRVDSTPSSPTLFIQVELSTTNSQITPSVECITAHYSPAL